MGNKKFYSESIYPEYRKIKVSRVDSHSTNYGDNYEYDTNYNLFNLKKKKISLSAMRSACFSAITNKDSQFIKNYKNAKKYRLDIFIPSCECGLTKSELMRFIRCLRVIGKFKFKTLKNYRLNYPKKKNNTFSLRKAQDVYLIQLNYSDYKSTEHIKLLTHTLRYCYEYENYHVIRSFLKFKDNPKNKRVKIPFLSTFYTFIRYETKVNGHYNFVTLSTLDDEKFIKNFIGNVNEYDNSSFLNLQKSAELSYSYTDYNNWSHSTYKAFASVSRYMPKSINEYKSYKDFLNDVKIAVEKAGEKLKDKKDLVLNNYE